MRNSLPCGGAQGSRVGSPTGGILGKETNTSNLEEEKEGVQKENNENQNIWSGSQPCELGSMRISTGLPTLLIAGFGGRGSKEESQLTSIMEAAKRISIPCTSVCTRKTIHL